MEPPSLCSLMKIKKEIGCSSEMSLGGMLLTQIINLLKGSLNKNVLIMLAIFVVFRMFLTSVKRLRIMRTSEANGLGMQF